MKIIPLFFVSLFLSGCGSDSGVVVEDVDVPDAGGQDTEPAGETSDGEDTTGGQDAEPGGATGGEGTDTDGESSDGEGATGGGDTETGGGTSDGEGATGGEDTETGGETSDGEGATGGEDTETGSETGDGEGATDGEDTETGSETGDEEDTTGGQDTGGGSDSEGETDDGGDTTGGNTETSDNSGVTSARYRLTFNASWSAETHMLNFPDNAHFSGLVGAVHNEQVVFWEPGQIATDGIEEMAETGGKTLILAEVDAAIANGYATAAIDGEEVEASPGAASVEFEVTTDYPQVTVTSMVAPSPDWFVGVHNLNLFDGTNFIDSLTRELAVYDSGTDGGVSFTSADEDTSPRDPISLVSSDPLDAPFIDGLPSVGQFVIVKLP